ncbi:MAG: hypothetical protein E3J23_02875 [Candidatus Stahlbacteria bacterium]|nr:MAG: hypothetical protein E3J23_02875 [Candidatus Stahlbacteria bacterium]
MTYCTETDVYHETGYTTNLIQRLTEKTAAQVTTMIDGFITKAKKKINGAVAIPYVVHQERHIVEDVPIEGDEGKVTRIYLGMYETDMILETYAVSDSLIMEDFNVQDCVVKVLRVWVNCYRKAKNDEDYGWVHAPSNGYIDFIGKAGGGEDLAEGTTVHITYLYNPFLVNVPENIKTACAQFAGIALIDHLLGIREGYQAFEAEDLLPLTDKENLYAKKGSLLARAKENLRSYGFGWHGSVV